MDKLFVPKEIILEIAKHAIPDDYGKLKQLEQKCLNNPLFCVKCYDFHKRVCGTNGLKCLNCYKDLCISEETTRCTIYFDCENHLCSECYSYKLSNTGNFISNMSDHLIRCSKGCNFACQEHNHAMSECECGKIVCFECENNHNCDQV